MSLAIGWQTDAVDIAVLGKVLANHIVSGIEAQVTTPDGGSWLSWGVAELLLTVVAALLWSGVLVAWCAEVDTDVAVVEKGLVLGLEGFGSIISVAELDVSETLASARVAVGDDADTCELSELLKLTSEPLLVDVPAEVTNEQVGNSIWVLCLGLLRGLLWLTVGLALLALDLGSWLLLLFFIIARFVGVAGSLRQVSLDIEQVRNK